MTAEAYKQTVKRTLRVFAWLLIVALPVTSSCSRQSEVPADPVRRPNIVLITVDTLRADHVGSQDGAPSLTPNIDALAERSVVFRNAITPIGTTGPAHASLFTGLPPRVHGVRWNGDRLTPDFPTLAGLLRSAGYDTAAFVSMPLLISGVHLGRGFTALSDGQQTDQMIRSGADVNRLAERWLEESREAPLFLWLHYYEVHSPYRLTAHARERLGDYDGVFARGASVDQFYSLGTDKPIAAPKNAENLAALNLLYDGEVIEADLLVAQILAALDPATGAHAPKGDTVVILTSDHGQLLGEHDKLGHGFMVWEEALRVPLIIHDPRASAEQSLVRVDERVSLMDLFPTILEYADLPVPEESVGQSLLPALSGGEHTGTLYFAETRNGNKPRQATVAFDGFRKVVLSGGEVRAFDLNADPDELTPLFEVDTPAWQRLAEVVRAYDSLRPGAQAERELDESTLEQLRKLGYVK